jgi:hypothetical protein
MRCFTRQGAHRFERAVIAAVLALLPSCGGSPTAPDPGPVAELTFTSSTLDLSGDLQAETSLRNVGTVALGPVTIAAGPLELGGVSVPGASVEAGPADVPTLNPGAGVNVTVTVVSDVALQPGSYSARLDAVVAGRSEASVGLGFVVEAPAVDVASIEILGAPPSARQGDVLVLSAEVRDRSGSTMDGVQVAWTVSPPGAGLITAEGRFVGYEPGVTQLTASAGSEETTATIEVSPRGLAQGSFTVSGQGVQDLRFNSDLWVHGDCAYTGTWGDRQGQLGNTLNVWDISDPTAPGLAAEVLVDARVVNDVKVRSDGKVAVISHEFSLDQLNGITLLDLSAACNPTVISRFTTGLQSGIHNVWIEGEFVYVVTDGVGSGLRILDISDPEAPTVVASFADPFSFLHDVYVRDGLAFLSHWDSGLIILDVGNGIVGGSPNDPREVSRVRTSGGQTHNAWYWPERGLVFVGEEDFNTPGIMHVVDVADLFAPVEVATFRVTADTPHNFWLDEEREILHMAWYTQGIISLDVSGGLLGDLERQGRTVASQRYSSIGACPGIATGTCAWAPQLHEGLLYLADMNTGLWVLTPEF